MATFTISHDFYLLQLAEARSQSGVERNDDPLENENFPLTCLVTDFIEESDFLLNEPTEEAEAIAADDAELKYETPIEDLYLHFAIKKKRNCGYIGNTNGNSIRCSETPMNFRASYCLEHHRMYHQPKTKKMNLSDKILYGDGGAHIPFEIMDRTPQYEHVY